MKLNPLIVRLKKTNESLQNQSLTIYLEVLRRLCTDHPDDTEVQRLAEFISKRDFDSMLSWADFSSSQMYEGRTVHFVRNQFAALIKKYPWDKLVKADPRSTALKKFWKSEHKCLRINQKFKARRNCFRGDNELVLSRMRSFITYVIGFAPDLESIFSEAAFGPGASIGVHGQCTNVARKLLSGTWTVTPGAYYYAYWSVMKHAQFREVLIPEHGGFTSGSPDFEAEKKAFEEKTRVIRHNKITLVPKTAKVHRTIAIEPMLNGYIQKGTDLLLRRKLKRVGLDLTDQGRNQEYARIGSTPGELDPFCTIDLSSASDSIATEVVREILPPEWFEFLDATRSKQYELDGEKYTYHKFCSMGNGFCFPLETLIFSAACHAVGAGLPGKDFLVYGDDIIVRRSAFVELVSLLNYLGFEINKEKTFSEGLFRESCGSDWFEGKDVRPTTLDFALESIPNIFKLLNLTLRSERTEMFFSGVRPFLLSLIPKDFLFFRPCKGNADTGIDSTGDEHLSARHCRYNKNLQCWEYKELIYTATPDNFWRKEKYGHLAHMWGALSGSASAAPFSRRKSRRTRVRFTAYSGVTSLWLPALT